MKVKFFAPSYKRPQKSITQNNYPFVKLVVRQSDAEHYIKNGNNILIVPDSAQGNIAKIRNYILDNLFDEETDCIVMMDDDCSGIYRWEEQKKIKIEGEDLIEFSEMASILCKEYGFKHWGLNCVQDKGAYREHTPFGTLQFIGAPFSGHLRHPLRYDENISLKEDYDMTLQQIKTYGGCLRLNFANYNVKQAEQQGGCATYRNNKKEKEQFELLQKKWGSAIVTKDKMSKREFDFNPILKVPLRGV